MLIIQEIRANQDYEGNKVDLTTRSSRAVAKNIWVQTQHPGDPGNKKDNILNMRTIWQQNWRLCLQVNICRHHGDRGEI